MEHISSHMVAITLKLCGHFMGSSIMKSPLLHTLVIAAMITGALAYGAEKLVERPPSNWQPIVDLHYPGGKAFVDVNSIGKDKDDNKYHYGNIMISLDKETTVTFDDVKFKARSMVKTVIMNCKTGKTSSTFDYYFKEAMPGRQAKPIQAYQYPTTPDSMINLPLSHPIHTVLCPVYD